jgi:hypothetical protein
MAGASGRSLDLPALAPANGWPSRSDDAQVRTAEGPAIDARMEPIRRGLALGRITVRAMELAGGGLQSLSEVPLPAAAAGRDVWTREYRRGSPLVG